MRIQFPDNFAWGAATAAYQIEGGANADGKGPSIWDRFSHEPGRVKNGDTGDVACDHYHRWPEDIALMKRLGLKAYRFSIAWPRIFPSGPHSLNQRGLDFYSRLVDGLLAAGIEPYVTLYHWDLPQFLQDQGGWPRRELAENFANYADTMFRALGDRVTHWITLNEPWVSAILGYGLGVHAPGIQDMAASVAASHHLLLAHGLAMKAARAALPPTAQVGITLNLTISDPATDSPADHHAAEMSAMSVNQFFLDPLFWGRYPESMLQAIGADRPPIHPGDLATIAEPIDFLGVNYYTRSVVQHDPNHPMQGVEIKPTGSAYTEMGWEVYPEGLYRLLTWLKAEYRNPVLYITENGAAYADALVDGQVNDSERLAYLKQHFAAARRAIDEGVRLRGYFVWSLMDNFEWAEGYTKRFGIVYVDYPTQQRIPKASARWYAQVIAQNAIQE